MANRTQFDIVSDLKHDGYTQIGDGMFSTVWARPGDNVVVKVGRTIEDSWLKYAQWVKDKHEKNPHFPKIYMIEIYDRAYVAKIERLEPMTYDPLSENHVDQFILGQYEVGRRIFRGLPQEKYKPFYAPAMRKAARALI